MRLWKKFLGTVMLCALLSVFVSAQNPGNQSAINPNDPIVEALDSLVAINNVIRYNPLLHAETGETSRYDYPQYSDEIYRQRISKISSPIPLTFNDEVKQYIELYAYKRRGLTSRVMGLSNLYFPLFEEVLDKEGLPLEFKYLAIVESALNPVAVSRMGATGLWQFMFNTGKMYDLKINSYFDERRDPVKATHAACKYFKDMYAIYNDWLLVIASYNCGPGNVNKAIRRSGGKTNFWEIAKYLPAETRGYVPAFIAVTYVMNYTNEHSIFPVAPAFNYFEVDTVAVDHPIALKKIADAIDLPLDVITYLNPVYKRGTIPPTGHPHILRLPLSHIPAYLAAEPSLYGDQPLVALASQEMVPETDLPKASVENGFVTESKRIRKVYTVRSGDNLSAISNRLKCSVTDLRKWNKLSSNNILKGQKLSYYTYVQVKTPVAVDKSETTANTDSASADKQSNSGVDSKNTTAGTNIIYHKVEKGDTLWNIARRYEGVTVEQIMELNRITNINNLVPGTKLKVKVNG
jgi:membrane-bound lytic murein transglycosylase D